ncbi:MAG: hypothetical protein DRH93_03375 [Deltaproteobacteria bacterium]|nr:MAG: hypothetical protein DRH93_03375 [Deltaproteobacteria bacterium]
MQRTLKAIRKRYDTIEEKSTLEKDLKALERIIEMNFMYRNIEFSIVRGVLEMMYTRNFELSEMKRKEKAAKEQA